MNEGELGKAKANGQNGIAVVVGAGSGAVLARRAPNPYFDRDVLTDWVRDKSDPRQKKYQAVMFTLSHESATGWYVLTSAPVPKSASPEEREYAIQRLVDEFEHDAHSIAAPRPTVQSFRVGSHVTDKPDEPASGVLPFNVAPNEDYHDGGRTNAENEVAIIAHYQRSLDGANRQSAQSMQQCMDRLFEDNKDQRRYTESLLEKNLAYAERIEKLLDASSARAINEYREKMRIDVEAQLYKALFTWGVPIAGAVVQKLGGAPVMPALEGGADGGVLEFAKTLGPRQLATLIKSLTDEQKAKFLPMAKALVDGMSEDNKREMLAIMQTDQQAAEGEK